MRTAAQRWCREVVGQRVPRTTRRQPLAVFRQEECQTLAGWDGPPYEVTDWCAAKVHPDHQVACQYALYSVPAALCSPEQQVEVGLGSKLVRIHRRGRLRAMTRARVDPSVDQAFRSFLAPDLLILN